MELRIIDTEEQEELHWKLGDMHDWIGINLLDQLPRTGDVLFHTMHYLVVNCVRNFDRGEVFLYVKPLYGFKPMEDNPLDLLKWSR